MFDGESLCSFFFRKQLLYGEQDFSNLISHLGDIYIKPKALVGRRDYLGNYQDKDLLLLLEKNEIIPVEPRLFSEPSHYIEKIKEYFYHHDFPKKSVFYPYGKPRKKAFYYNDQPKKVDFDPICLKYVAFCPDCISSSLVTNGVGYLKYQWQNARVCTIHNTQLLAVSRSTRKKTIEAIKVIISGQIPDDAIDVFKFSVLSTKKHQRSMSRPDYFYSCLGRDSPIVMTKCLAHDFYIYIRSIENNIDDTIAHKMRFKNRKSLLKSLRNCRYQYEQLEHGLLACLFFVFLDLEDIRLRVFLRQSSKVIDVYAGTYNSKSILQKMWKSNKLNCSLCPRVDWSDSCPASQVLMKKRLYHPVLYQESQGGVCMGNGIDWTASRSLTPELIAKRISKYPYSKCLLYTKGEQPMSKILLGWTECTDRKEHGEQVTIHVPALYLSKESKILKLRIGDKLVKL